MARSRTKAKTLTKSGIIKKKDENGFVTYSCPHMTTGNRKEIRMHLMRDHYGFYRG